MPFAGRKRKSAATPLQQEDMASFCLTSRCVKQSRYISGRHVEDLSLTETPYGRLTKSLHVNVTSGEPLVIQYCCPFAWLYLICSKCELMLHFLLAALRLAWKRCSVRRCYNPRKSSAPRQGADGELRFLVYRGISRLVPCQEMLLVDVRQHKPNRYDAHRGWQF